MLETKIPGLCAHHAIITPECRFNRGMDGAFIEAIARIKREYDASLSDNPAVRAHIVLTVESQTC